MLNPLPRCYCSNIGQYITEGSEERQSIYGLVKRGGCAKGDDDEACTEQREYRRYSGGCLKDLQLESCPCHFSFSLSLSFPFFPFPLISFDCFLAPLLLLLLLLPYFDLSFLLVMPELGKNVGGGRFILFFLISLAKGYFCTPFFSSFFSLQSRQRESHKKGKYGKTKI